MNTEQLKTDDAFEDKYINPIVDSILLYHSRQPIKRLSDFVSQEIQRDLESRWIDPLDVARFWIKVDQTNFCWLWKSSVNKHGYGTFQYKNESLAHRLSWIIVYGPIPDDKQVLHRCDNPKCVNPNHLFIGTHQDNMRDKMHKGRGRHQGKTSKYYGVGFRNDSGNWRSYVTLSSKLKHLGTFDNELDAARYRDQYVIDNNLDLPLNFPLPISTP